MILRRSYIDHMTQASNQHTAPAAQSVQDSPSSLPRPEYPRPQFVRREWMNLNGVWEFMSDSYDQGLRRGWNDGRKLKRRIRVPFAYQTKLSGINEQDIYQVAWYARDFEVPAH